MTDAERLRQRAKKRSQYARMTPEQRKRHYERVKAYRAGRTPEQREAARIARIAAYRAEMEELKADPVAYAAYRDKENARKRRLYHKKKERHLEAAE